MREIEIDVVAESEKKQGFLAQNLVMIEHMHSVTTLYDKCDGLWLESCKRFSNETNNHHIGVFTFLASLYGYSWKLYIIQMV